MKEPTKKPEDIVTEKLPTSTRTPVKTHENEKKYFPTVIKIVNYVNHYKYRSIVHYGGKILGFILFLYAIYGLLIDIFDIYSFWNY